MGSVNNLLFVNDSHEVILESIYTVRVKEAMNANPMKVAPDDTMRSAKNIMRDNGLTGLPVVDGNRLAGILSLYDIMACYDNGNLDEKVSKYMSRDVILLEEDMPISFAINYFNKGLYENAIMLYTVDNLVDGKETITVGLKKYNIGRLVFGDLRILYLGASEEEANAYLSSVGLADRVHIPDDIAPIEIDNRQRKPDGFYYTLDGRRLYVKPSSRGIYIK